MHVSLQCLIMLLETGTSLRREQPNPGSLRFSSLAQPDPIIHFANDFSWHTGLVLNPLTTSQSPLCISRGAGFRQWLTEERQNVCWLYRQPRNQSEHIRSLDRLCVYPIVSTSAATVPTQSHWANSRFWIVKLVGLCQAGVLDSDQDVCSVPSCKWRGAKKWFLFMKVFFIWHPQGLFQSATVEKCANKQVNNNFL